MHRVFSSYDKYSASARKIQFHWTYIGDSGEVVTPFMQVGNYPTRNFATLGPSRITAAVYERIHSELAQILLTSRTGQVSAPILHLTILQRPVFLLNSRYPLFYVALKKFLLIKPSLSRSYRVNLPSSFNIINPSVLVHLHPPTCVGFSTI